jgi:hypothetical protein
MAMGFIVLYSLFPIWAGIAAPRETLNRNSKDSIIILVNIDYAENFPGELKNEIFISDLLKPDFKQWGKKQGKKFAIFLAKDSSSRYDYSLDFFLYNFHFGTEKNDQTMRLATMKRIETVYDVEAGQHKRADADYSADVTHVKNSVDCDGSIAVSVKGWGNDSLLFKKSFDGKYSWQNEYVTFKGDKEALTTDELQLSRNRPQESPVQKYLYRELANAIYKDISKSLNSFFKDKKGF